MIFTVELELSYRRDEIHVADRGLTGLIVLDMRVHGTRIARDENTTDQLSLAERTLTGLRGLLVAVDLAKVGFKVLALYFLTWLACLGRSDERHGRIAVYNVAITAAIVA
jgi:hypothetical protein